MNTEKRNTILVIDDEPSNIVAIRHMLGSDYTIYGVTDGMSGITAAKLQNPDLILLDIIMPEMDGYEVLKRLKSTVETQDIPVIIITKLSSEESEEKGLILGAEDYIQKPFSSVVVKLRVNNLLKGVSRERIIRTQLQHQALLKKISQSYLSGAGSISSFPETLRLIGEFMELSNVRLYILDENDKVLKCQSEWINPEVDSESCLNGILELEDTITENIENALNGDDVDVCFHSNDPQIKDFMKPSRKNSEDFIITPVFVMGKVGAVLDFSKSDDGRDWSDSEINLAILISCVFSSYLERNQTERSI